MRFEPGLETAYRDSQFIDGLKYLRINLLILLALVLSIVQVDRLVMQEFTSKVPAFARVGVMAPILAIGFALTFLRLAATWYPRIMTVLMSVGVVGGGWVGLLAWSLGEDRVFVRFIIGIIALYLVMGLRFRLALTANLISIVFYAAAASAIEIPPPVMTQFLAMLLTTSVICAAGAYNLEHARRMAWLEGQLLKQIARRDALTGINNRRRLDEHLQQVWQHGLREHKPIALLFVDIDCFKTYNDHYGHQAGDEALKAVAAQLSRFGRRPFDMAARFGGEEFAIVLFDTSHPEAVKIGEAILAEVQALKIPHTHSTTAEMLTVSIGIACAVPATERDCAGLLQGADQALYAAKNAGRNRVHLLGA